MGSVDDVRDFASVPQLDLLRAAAVELQQPLTHISGTVQLVQEVDLTEAEQKDHLKRLGVSTARMQQLLESMLLATQVEGRQVDLVFEPLNPAAVIHRAIDDLRPLARHNNIQINEQFSQNLQLVSANPTALYHAVHCLIDVVVRSSQSSVIDVLVHNQGDEVMITIRDDSQSLPARSLSALLKRFGKAVQPIKQLPVNAALGVYIAQVLATNTNCSLHFHSERGKRHISMNLPLSRQMSLSL